MAAAAAAPAPVSVANAEEEARRRVLLPGGNKARSAPPPAKKPKPLKKPLLLPFGEVRPVAAGGGRAEKVKEAGENVNADRGAARKSDAHVHVSLDASCGGSDVSVESVRSSASARRVVTKIGSAAAGKKKKDGSDAVRRAELVPASPESGRSRCAWVTPHADPCYIAFHDEEWGAPVHDDRRLFELLVLASVLAERTWPEILVKRRMFREVFMDFDPAAVSKLSEKKMTAPGSAATSLMSEQKLRAVLENARPVLKVVDEFGSFAAYCWSFVNGRPVVSGFRYPRQVPAKSPKADLVSKDMIRRGFRSVSPTIIYSFMQASGLTNDHLVSCFRFEECAGATAGGGRAAAGLLK